VFIYKYRQMISMRINVFAASSSKLLRRPIPP
jgi:hypothetical protein